MKESLREFSEVFLNHPTPLERSTGAWLLRIGKNKAKPNYKAGPRIGNLYSLHFILEGCVQLRMGTYTGKLQEGSIFCLYPDRLLEYSIVPSSRPLKMIWIGFNGHLAEPILENIGFSPDRPFIYREISDQINELYRKLKQLLIKPENNCCFKNISHLFDVFHLLQSNELKTDSSAPPRAWQHQAEEFMQMHFVEGIHVQDVVRHMSLDRSYFTKAFTAHAGETPKNYLRRLRMEYAASLLHETTWQITQIASSVGYADLFGFTRSFKKYYGLSPVQFRKEREKELSVTDEASKTSSTE